MPVHQVEWKLSHGKWRPNLLKYAESQSVSASLNVTINIIRSSSSSALVVPDDLLGVGSTDACVSSVPLLGWRLGQYLLLVQAARAANAACWCR